MEEGALVVLGSGAGAARHRHARGAAAEAQASIDVARGAARRRLGYPSSNRRARSTWLEFEAARAQNLVKVAPARNGTLDVRNNEGGDDQAAMPLAVAGSDAQDRHARGFESRARQRRHQYPDAHNDDATLRRSTVTGRVLYRLAGLGGGLAAGGRALTALSNLEDVYMEDISPVESAASLKVGAEERITVDYDPHRAVAGYVSWRIAGSADSCEGGDD